MYIEIEEVKFNCELLYTFDTMYSKKKKKMHCRNAFVEKDGGIKRREKGNVSTDPICVSSYIITAH